MEQKPILREVLRRLTASLGVAVKGKPGGWTPRTLGFCLGGWKEDPSVGKGQGGELWRDWEVIGRAALASKRSGLEVGMRESSGMRSVRRQGAVPMEPYEVVTLKGQEES